MRSPGDSIPSPRNAGDDSKDVIARRTGGVAVSTLVAAWLITTYTHQVPPRSDLLVSICLGLVVLAAYQWPLALRPRAKVYMASIPFYLLAALVAPVLAVTAGALASLLSEISVRRRRGTSLPTIITEAGRRTLIIWPGTLVAHLPVAAPWHMLALLLAAVVMELTDIGTCPLVLAPLSGEPPLHIIMSVAQGAYLVEGGQYLLGLLGALAAEREFWTVTLLAVPTALLYLTFQALGRAESAQQAAEQAQDAASKAQRIAEEAVKVRDTFLLTGSHDLRTPLTAVLGRAELLQTILTGSGPVNTEQLLNQVEAMRRAAKRMHATVEELTDVAHLQMGQTLTLNIASVDLGSLIDDVAQMVVAASSKTAAPIEVHVPSTVIVQADAARLTRAFENIIGNAVKYSPPEMPVQVTVAQAEDRASITVHDHGLGIEPADLPHIFMPFYRASKATGFPGNGIGLAGTRIIIEQHDGQITIESGPTQGTTVVVTLPRTLPARGNRAVR